MHDSLEIEKKDNGYSVDVMAQHDDEYDIEELVFQDPLDVVGAVLRWLDYGEGTATNVIEMLEEDTAYVLTDKGRETLARLERERAELARLEHERADLDWEIRRVEAAELKRGPGRGGYWHTTGTGANTAGEY